MTPTNPSSTNSIGHGPKPFFGQFEKSAKLLERCALLISVQFSLMILINEKINGIARERILIAAFRWLSDIDSKQFEQSCIIFQASEEQSAGLQIAEFISRLKIKPAFLRRIVQMIIRRDLFKDMDPKSFLKNQV